MSLGEKARGQWGLEVNVAVLLLVCKKKKNCMYINSVLIDELSQMH